MEFIHLTDNKQFHSDIRELINANKNVFVPYGECGGTQYEDNIRPDFFDNYKKDSEDSIICLSDNELIGLLCVEPESSRDDVPIDNDDFSYISIVLVDSSYRNKGIGAQLYQHVIELQESGYLHDKIALSTWSSNTVQKHLCNKFEFHEFYRKENHRFNGDDTVYYSRDATDPNTK